MATLAGPRSTQLTVIESDEGLLVTIVGVIDVRSAADLRSRLHALIDADHRPLLLDLGAAEVSDATGLGLLLECHRRGRRLGRAMHVVAVTPGSQRLLRRLALSRRLGGRPAYR